METPTPVNLNALTSILAKSKQVMKKIDNEKPIVTNGNETKGLSETSASSTAVYSENDEREPVYEQYLPQTNIHEVSDYTEDQVRNSKLPPVIKEAMLKKHIPKATFSNSKFSLDDVSALIEKKPLNQPQQPHKNPINEVRQSSNDMINVSRSELQNMINEAVIKYFKTSYDKTITEDTIKKTINVLIKEGKIIAKKK